MKVTFTRIHFNYDEHINNSHGFLAKEIDIQPVATETTKKKEEAGDDNREFSANNSLMGMHIVHV